MNNMMLNLNLLQTIQFYRCVWKLSKQATHKPLSHLPHMVRPTEAQSSPAPVLRFLKGTGLI